LDGLLVVNMVITENFVEAIIQLKRVSLEWISQR
jgi:hypothetical protein